MYITGHRLIVCGYYPSLRFKLIQRVLTLFNAVDAKIYWRNRLEQLDRQLESERTAPHQLTQCAFVTFNNVAAAQQAAQTLHNFDSGINNEKTQRWTKKKKERTNNN
jgi:hypothetical protein